MAGVRLPKSFQSFAFNGWKYTDERQKWKEKVQKNTQFPFCGQTKAFRYEIVILVLGLFWTNQGTDVVEEISGW